MNPKAAVVAVRNWRATLTSLEQVLLVIATSGGGLIGLLPGGSPAQRWLGIAVAVAGPLAAAIQAVISGGQT